MNALQNDLEAIAEKHIKNIYYDIYPLSPMPCEVGDIVKLILPCLNEATSKLKHYLEQAEQDKARLLAEIELWKESYNRMHQAASEGGCIDE